MQRKRYKMTLYSFIPRILVGYGLSSDFMVGG
jgi:hypothetical protein